MLFTVDEIHAGFLAWITDEHNGNCISHEQADAMPIEEKAKDSTEAIVHYIKLSKEAK